MFLCSLFRLCRVCSNVWHFDVCVSEASSAAVCNCYVLFSELGSMTKQILSIYIRDVTDSPSESDGIRHFFGNPKSDRYLKSDHDRFTDIEIFVLVHVYNYFRK